MDKKKATEETINSFMKAVYPEMTELAVTLGSEDSILRDAAEKIAAMKDEIWHLKGAMKADDERLVAAAKKAGELDLGCDMPDWLAETILEQREQIAALKHRLELATNMYLSHKDKTMVELKRQIAALTAQLETHKRLNRKYPQGANGCCCLFDDEDNQIEWCAPHAELRDERDRLGEALRIISQRVCDFNYNQCKGDLASIAQQALRGEEVAK